MAEILGAWTFDYQFHACAVAPAITLNLKASMNSFNESTRREESGCKARRYSFAYNELQMQVALSRHYLNIYSPRYPDCSLLKLDCIDAVRPEKMQMFADAFS